MLPYHAMQRQANGSYTLTLTDTNGVLGSYQFSSQSPVTLSQSGNTLTATAGSGASWDTLTFSASRTMINPENPACLFRIFYLDDNNQALASPPDKASIPSDPVPAYFKIDGEAAPGSATMSKAAESGPVDGYCFKMWQANGNKTYYGKSDSKGNVYVTDSHYAASGTKKLITPFPACRMENLLFGRSFPPATTAIVIPYPGGLLSRITPVRSLWTGP